MKVQELLSSKKKWTQGTLTRNRNGKPVEYESSDAAKWSLVGAIRKCYTSSEEDEIVDKIEDMIKMSIIVFNDTSSYEEVMELVRKMDI